MSNHPIDIVRPGLEARCELVVTPSMGVPAFAPWFSSWGEMPDVLATIVVGGLIEEACVRAVHPRLPAEHITLGILLNIDHLAPSKIGDQVEARATLVAIEGRTLTFEAECSGSGRLIAKGLHKRRIVDRARFAAGEGTPS